MVTHPFLGLVALGPIDPDILRSLRTTLAKFLLLPVQVLRPQPLSPQTYHLIRQQYHSTQVLAFLIDDEEIEVFRILGLTAQDL